MTETEMEKAYAAVLEELRSQGLDPEATLREAGERVRDRARLDFLEWTPEDIEQELRRW